MGKLLFVNTNRANGIVGLIVCAGAICVGIWAAFDGAYAGLIMVPLGLLGGKFCLKIATQRAELYEQGFASKNIFGQISARYADLKSITRGAVSRNGVLQTHILFTTQRGETATITNEKFLKGDGKMELLLDRSCAALAETWAKTLDRQTEVVWLVRGTSPLLKIRKDGIMIEGKSGADGFIPLGQFAAKQAYGLDVNLLNGDKKVITVSSGEPNYFVGWALLDVIARKQQAKAATTQG